MNPSQEVENAVQQDSVEQQFSHPTHSSKQEQLQTRVAALKLGQHKGYFAIREWGHKTSTLSALYKNLSLIHTNGAGLSMKIQREGGPRDYTVGNNANVHKQAEDGSNVQKLTFPTKTSP